MKRSKEVNHAERKERGLVLEILLRAMYRMILSQRERIQSLEEEKKALREYIRGLVDGSLRK